MIRLPREFYIKIIDAAKKGIPEEICGLIGGIVNDNIKTVKEIYFLENADHSNEHFSINPKEQLNAIKDMRKMGYVPLGNFHSHPESPSRPSEEDKRMAYDKVASYLILSLIDIDAPVLKSFKISDGISEEEEIEYI